jgi:hypothetical protein
MRQFPGIARNNIPRGISGARAAAAAKARDSKLEMTNLGPGNARIRASRAATIVPVAVSRPRLDFSSTLASRPSSARSATASARVGTRSCAKAASNQLPASQLRTATRGSALTLPRPSVVRSSRSSWRRTGWSSPVRRTSNSTQLQPRAFALRRAPSVFSGAQPAAPRWPITRGRSVSKPVTSGGISDPVIRLPPSPVAPGAPDDASRDPHRSPDRLGACSA